MNPTRRALAVLFVLGAATTTFAEPTNGWTPWAPRDEIAPKFNLDARSGRERGPALKIETRSLEQFGAWKKRFDGLTGGRTYRFTTWYRTSGVADERRSVIPRLEWQDAKGRQTRPPEYGIAAEKPDGKWKKVELVTTIPTNAVSAEVQLGLGFDANATVWWDHVVLAPVDSAPSRVIRAATVHHRPRSMKSAAEALEQFCSILEKHTHEKLDLICLPEGATVVGTGKSYAEVSEPVPGPSTERLGKLAKQLNSYIVAGIYERAGKIVYNTAVLVGRDGKLIGKYRKTHLPREEWESGITPGDSYPVFETDFGKVGIMICWDLQFPEPCRSMAAQGAEIVLLPIWGGSEVLAQARAIENHVFLISSTYDMRSFIVDPAGKILAEGSKDRAVASAELQLDRKIFQPWLGDMKYRTWKERRTDIAVP